jgi:hypothetical protein
MDSYPGRLPPADGAGGANALPGFIVGEEVRRGRPERGEIARCSDIINFVQSARCPSQHVVSYSRAKKATDQQGNIAFEKV